LLIGASEEFKYMLLIAVTIAINEKLIIIFRKWIRFLCKIDLPITIFFDFLFKLLFYEIYLSLIISLLFEETVLTCFRIEF
jgi:hypothetical protein